MIEGIGLEVKDGLLLPTEYQALLQPGQRIVDSQGHIHFLPRFFYELNSWEQAKETKLSPHFTLAELVSVDCREADLLLNRFPHYMPCAVTFLCRYLEVFRGKVNASVYVSCNGGYRSPAHQLSKPVGTHNWATASNIYRIGDTYLNNQKDIEKYARIAESIGPEVFTKPFGHGLEETDDHLHIDIGYVNYVPRNCNEKSSK